MRKTALLLSIVLFLWIVGASYYYVCKIRKHCKCSEKVENSAPVVISDSDMNTKTDTIVIEKVDTIADKLADIRDYLNKEGEKAVYFDFAEKTAKITSDNYTYLDKVVFLLKNDSDSRVRISGHSDNIGSEEAKKEFGKARAEFVKKALCEKGVASNQIETKSYSDKKPVEDNNTEEGRAKNRRAEILILNQ